MEFNQAFKSILKRSESLPFLFVGSGFSRRYLGAKNWEDLLRYFSSIVDPSDYAYEKYETKAVQMLKQQNRNKTRNNLLTTIADLIEFDFNGYWYESEKFIENRRLYKQEIQQHKTTPFKLELSNYFKSIEENSIPLELEREIELLKIIGKKSIAGVITTNYDLFLENIFPDYGVYVGQEELIFSTTHGIAEIYKIHGCCSKPNSIVINSKDYEDFDKRNAYLAAKLMTIFVEHPVIFIGYSMDDENIQTIIKSIVDCLNEEKLDRLKDRLIFVEWVENQQDPEIFPHSRDFGQSKSINMTKIKTGSFEPLFQVISEHKARYSAQFYRKIKRDIYELALTSEANEKILVLPSTDERLLDEDYEIIIGFGIVELGRRGYRSIKAEEIFMDVLFNNGRFNDEMLIKEALPDLIKRTSGSLPVFKYIRSYDSSLPPEFERYKNFKFKNLVTNTILSTRETMRYKSIKEIIQKNNNNLSRQVRFIQALDEHTIDPDELGNYLRNVIQENPTILSDSKPEIKSGLKKLIRMYDYMKNYKK